MPETIVSKRIVVPSLLCCCLWVVAHAPLSIAADTAVAELSPTAAMLSEWIVASRDTALASGTQVIPEAVREALAGFVPDAILDKVRWQQVPESAVTLQTLFYLGHTPAITLDYVIVFESGSDAAADPKLWAHELLHVIQYERWGVAGFAQRYVDNYSAVEQEAWEFRWQWMKRTGRVP